MKKRPAKSSRAKPTHAPGLDEVQITQAALGLLDEAGLDGLTMRSLADRLGIKAASLYWHIPSKQKLLSLMANEICAPMQAPDRVLPWQQQLRALGSQYRQVLLGHRDAARVLAATSGPSGPNVLRLTEIVLRALVDAGFGGKEATYAGSMLNDYVVMFVSEETRAAQWLPEETSQDAVAEPPNWLAGLSATDYPSLKALEHYLLEADADERFQFGSDILISGLEARLAKTKA